MSIKIAIADDHPIVIGGLQNMLPLYPHIALIGTYTNGVSLLEGLEHEVPDVLLLDIQLPDKSGEELTPVLLKKHPELKILILTNFDSTLYIANLFALGAHGYILKTAEKEILIRAIETVYKGNQFIEPLMQEKMDQTAIRIAKRSSLKSALTLREKEILQLIVDGSTNPEIAKKLFLSLNTIENYRTNIMLKLDVNNAAALVKKALKAGLAQ